METANVLSSNPWCYFYEFLRRSDRHNWSPNVMRDFADIDDYSGFDDWWADHEKWFEPLSPLVVRELGSEAEFNEYFIAADDPSAMNEVVVLINLDMPRKLIFEELTKLFNDKVGPPKEGKPEFIGWTHGDYQLTAEPDCQALDNFLIAYDLNKKREAGEAPKTLYDIGVAMGLDKRAGHTAKAGEGTAGKKKRELAMASLVSKYVTRARQVMRGVEKGLFPAGSENTG